MTAPRVNAYIGLGSNLAGNLDSPAAQIESALQQLAILPESHLSAISPRYRSLAIGPAQPDYINAVVCLQTSLPPLMLLNELQDIEQAHARVRLEHWGPRTLDLDLLVVGEERCQGPSLTLPHAGTRDRNFVLWPLLEVAPGLWIPGTGYVQPLAAAAGSAGLVPVE